MTAALLTLALLDVPGRPELVQLVACKDKHECLSMVYNKSILESEKGLIEASDLILKNLLDK
jgi:hypothetical protein